MTFEIVHAFTGNLKEHFAGKTKAIRTAVQTAMRETAADAKADLRAQMRRGFKRTPPYARAEGQNIAKAAGAKAYPERVLSV